MVLFEAKEANGLFAEGAVSLVAAGSCLATGGGAGAEGLAA